MPGPFDPPPSLPGWNFDWESGGTWPAGNDGWFRTIFDCRVFNVYLDALNERILAYNALFPPLDHLASPDYSIQSGFPSATSWAGLQDLALQLAAFPYVVTYSGGGDYDYSTLRDITDVVFDVAILTATLRRKFPREINSLSDPGTDGWNARLLNIGGITRTYTRTAGVWIPAADGVNPDVLTDTGIIQSGDYFGPWILNDLRDLINLLVTYSTRNSDPGDPLSPFWDTNGEDNTNLNGTIFSGGPAGTATQPTALKGLSFGEPFQLRAYGFPHVPDAPFDGVRTRIYYFFSFGEENPSFPPFHAFGDPVLDTQLNLFDTSAPTTAGDYMGVQFGTTDFSTMTTDGGYNMADLYVFVRWDRPDGSGFQYTKYT